MNRAASWVVALSFMIAGSADEVRSSQWHLTFLDIPMAHSLSQGSGIVVALVDTGVEARHRDLQRNVQQGIDIVPGGTGDGRSDTDGHGTGMASLIAGHGRGQSDGIRGIAPSVRVVPIRISTPSRNGDTNDVAKGIEWAIDHGAAVICVPLAGGVSLDLLNAVQRARRSNVVVVAGAGNRPTNTGVAAPASFPGVIAAAAVDRNGDHHPGSVTGPEVVLAAPGVDIVSATTNDGYARRTGTSNASAIIAGAVALVRARYPGLSADQVIHRLTSTAIDKGPPGRDERYGYGVINIVAALTTPQPSATTTPGQPRGNGNGPLVGILVVLALAAGATATATAAMVARRRRR